MATGDEQSNRQEAMEAAEAAHLAARRLGRTSLPLPGRTRRPAPYPREHPTVRLTAGDRPTVPLPDSGAAADRPTVALDPHPPRPRRGAPLLVAAVVATGWAAIVSFLPVAMTVGLLVVLESGGGAIGAGLRVAGSGWLLAHGVPVDSPDGPVRLVPLAVSALASWRLARAGVHVTRAIGARGRRSFRSALLAAGAVAVTYAGIGVLVAATVSGPDWGVEIGRAALTLGGVGLITAGYGSLRTTGLLPWWWKRLPVVLRAGSRAGLVATLGVLASGAALAGAAIAAAGGEPADILAAFDTGVAGQAGLTLLCLAYAPNLAIWATAYLVGPGFAVGTDTVVRSREVTVGPLPALPVFAGLPEAALPTVGAVLLVVPVIVGVVSGVLVAREVTGGWQPLAAAVVSAVVAGVLLGGAASVSAGSLLAGRLATMGPEPLPVAGAAAGTVAVGALLGVAATAVLARRRR
jgi:hypothetical protein